jgi:precorrin-3B synthase
MSAVQTTRHEIKGWCPGALRPMQSGDGLIVRIRPPGGMLSAVQAAGIAQAARTHGNGIIDLSGRANLQLRGVRADTHAPLIADLDALGLLDPDVETEALRNLIVTPFRDAETEDLATRLTAALARMPRLPGKFGFAVDAGLHPVLTGASVDIRLERAVDGRLILRPDGHPLGRPVDDVAEDALAMARWFVEAGGAPDGRGRMAALIGRGVSPEGCTVAPANPVPPPLPGLHSQGRFVAFAFGQMQAETLSSLAGLGLDLRLTPWRMVLIVGLQAALNVPGLITDGEDPLLRVTACTGAPGCPQALGDTRGLAHALALDVPRDSHLHVSGCTKGCAHPGPAPLTLVASSQSYNLIRGGAASDAPHLTDLAAHSIADALRASHAPSI